ncbi:hypothetical protein HanIR_Chr06g0267121 [Helianthus annuus]|nr:hypothetical protein HanIR_Chr06g0267121 [Helianthus annuus]
MLIQRPRRSRSVMNWHNTRVILSTWSLNSFPLMRVDIMRSIRSFGAKFYDNEILTKRTFRYF